MKKILNNEISRLNIKNSSIKIIHTDGVVSDEETPLTAIKNSKEYKYVEFNKSSIRWRSRY